jgi:hypothetical protein
MAHNRNVELRPVEIWQAGALTSSFKPRRDWRERDGLLRRLGGCGGVASRIATASSSVLLETQMKIASPRTVNGRQMDICLFKLPLYCWSPSKAKGHEWIYMLVLVWGITQN